MSGSLDPPDPPAWWGESGLALAEQWVRDPPPRPSAPEGGWLPWGPGPESTGDRTQGPGARGPEPDARNPRPGAQVRGNRCSAIGVAPGEGGRHPVHHLLQ